MNGPLYPSIFYEAALNAVARGWAVFPLKPRDKIPATQHGSKDAEHSEAAIHAWWRAQPNANIGLATGDISGLWVLDVDGPEGEASLAALIAAHGPLPRTPEQSTGKGRHFLFLLPAGAEVRNSARKLGAGLDVRGRGGYIVLAPSVHPSGRLYQWTIAPNDAPLAEAPAWLMDLLAPPAPKPAAPLQPYKGDGRATAYGEKALDSAVHRIATAQPGSRHNTLAGEAACIGELVAGGEIERGYAERALVTAATAMMGGQITQRELSKISWGFAIGQTRPRKITRQERITARRTLPRAAAAAGHGAAAINRMRVTPPFGDPHAVLLVTLTDCADAALAAWRADGGGGFGLYVLDTLDQLSGGLAKNSGGYADWRLPRPAIDAPALTTPWRGRVLIVLPPDMEGFTVSKGTKFERFISVERQHQVIGKLTEHWWRQAGASDVRLAVLGGESEAA